MYGPRKRVSVWHFVWVAVVGLAVATSWRIPAAAQQQPTRGHVSMAGLSSGDVRDSGTRVTSMRRNGELRLRMTRADPLVAGRTHERLDQVLPRRPRLRRRRRGAVFPRTARVCLWQRLRRHRHRHVAGHRCRTRSEDHRGPCRRDAGPESHAGAGHPAEERDLYAGMARPRVRQRRRARVLRRCAHRRHRIRVQQPADAELRSAAARVCSATPRS